MTTNILIIDDDPLYRKILVKRIKVIFPDSVTKELDSLSKTREYFKLQSIDSNYNLVILDQNLSDGIGVEFLKENCITECPVIIMSSDVSPDIPGAAMKAGASYFLPKDIITEPYFKPLIEGIVDRFQLQKQLVETNLQLTIIDTVKTLVSTLQHEINNPLGAVLGAAFLLKSAEQSTKERKRTATLVEESGQRIKYVLEKLIEAIELNPMGIRDQSVKTKYDLFDIEDKNKESK